jgi:hypothetical protein
LRDLIEKTATFVGILGTLKVLTFISEFHKVHQMVICLNISHEAANAKNVSLGAWRRCGSQPGIPRARELTLVTG